MKTNIYKLSIILVPVFLCFLIFNFVNAGTGVYTYKNTTSGIKSNSFSTKELCEKERTEKFLTAITTACEETIAMAEPEVTNVNSQTPPSSNDTYNLLAPLPGLKTAPNNIGEYFNIMILIAIGLCAVLAVIMIVIGGIEYMGDESVFGKTQAKSQITKAILGLLIALGAYALLNTIDPNLLGGTINIKQVSAEIEEELVPWTTYEEGDDTTSCPGGFDDVKITGGNPSSINICGTVHSDLVDLINAAATDGYRLSGTGSRKKATQERLRAENCGGTANIYNEKASCTPKTAIPGTSNHEKGLAVDFNCNGVSMGKIDTNNICYKWLRENAKTYHFDNNFTALKETWHWSTGAKAGY